jgi:signal transduction histidine kinase
VSKPLSSTDVTTDLHSGTHVISRPAPGTLRPIRLLLVEDSDDDALLVARELRRGGYEPVVHRVMSRDEFRRALEIDAWDVIISDHSLPLYDGMSALADLQASGKDIPFILVSGTIGEAVAVSAMKAGAQDYVLKGDLTRLPVAVDRELREKALRVERTRMREQLVISERMASAGTLAAGVAHEINNPLAVAMANIEFMSDLLSSYAATCRDSEDTRRIAALGDPVRDTREALERIRDIVRDVKLFSRPEEESAGPVDVQRVIDSASRMAWNEIRHRAMLVKDYRPTPRAMANESRLGQVLLNLIVNAAQAMPVGQADRQELRVATRTGSDGCVVIEVTDTGAGIPKQNLDRIFDPFFTTKPVGVGTGLGLSICQRIVAQLGGSIEVESEMGKGSVFRVQLPAAPREAPEPGPSSAPPAMSTRARVMVVDDEAALGRVLSRILDDDHDVETATTGKDVLSRITAGQRFDVILSDLMMPEMTGMDLYRELQGVAPEQARRMVFLTGGAFTAAARTFLDEVPNPVVEKPLRHKELLAVIARTLEEHGGPTKKPGPER